MLPIPMPTPPWTFSRARVLYQPSLVPVDAARAVTPSAGLTLLSLFGWTLGGLFVVDWRESPVGPYREVAVLSGLVTRDWRIGAWASHIVVTTDDAAEGGRRFYGLPTSVGSIEFNSEGGDEGSGADDKGGWAEAAAEAAWDFSAAVAVTLKTAAGTAIPGVAEPAERLGSQTVGSQTMGSVAFEFFADDAVMAHGWDSAGWRPDEDTPDARSGVGAVTASTISLPSFSGRLPGASALLRYPLRLGPARSVRVRRAVGIRLPTEASAMSAELRAVLGGQSIGPCLQVDGVTVVAGTPMAVDDS